MAEDDVWAGTEVDSIGGPVGEGFYVNQAYSVDVVFKNGLAFVQDAPLLALGGGALVFAAQFLPSLISLPFNIIGGIAQGTNSQTGTIIYAVSQLINVALPLIAIPFQLLFMSGLAVGAARYAATGETSPRVLFTSVVPAIKGLLYGFLTTIVVALALSCVLTPFALFAGIGYYATHAVTLPIVLLVLAVVAWIPFGIYIGLGLQLGWYAAVIDGKWPIEALTASWTASAGSRLTLFITGFVLGLAAAVAGLSIYCLVGIALVPVILAITVGGQAISWLLFARAEATTKEWEFFKRNPPPYMF